MNFAIYYNDNAFLRAARTWKSNLKGGLQPALGRAVLEALTED